MRQNNRDFERSTYIYTYYYKMKTSIAFHWLNFSWCVWYIFCKFLDLFIIWWRKSDHNDSDFIKTVRFIKDIVTIMNYPSYYFDVLKWILLCWSYQINIDNQVIINQSECDLFLPPNFLQIREAHFQFFEVEACSTFNLITQVGSCLYYSTDVV